MKNIKLYINIFALATLLCSCTKVIDIKTGNESGKLDIEANVVDTTGLQTITLSRNVPFTNTNVYPAVSGAKVTVTDPSGNSYPFTESLAGTYTNAQLTGISGSAYKMTVTVNDTTYNATSTMPAKVALDSVTSQNVPLSTGSNPKKQIIVHYQDPKGVANYYRFVVYVNDVQLKAVFAFDDEFNDGDYVNNILFAAGDDITDIYAGDKVTVIMQCIDQPVYLYWFTLMQESGNGPGGSVTPSNPPTDITPVSLGYFSAHTSQTMTITVK
jgi:hypothetical protein